MNKTVKIQFCGGSVVLFDSVTKEDKTEISLVQKKPRGLPRPHWLHTARIWANVNSYILDETGFQIPSNWSGK